MSTLNVGDRVKYGVPFLRSAGEYGGALPLARGEIVAIGQLGNSDGKVNPDKGGRFAQVNWTNDYADEVPTLIALWNLVREDDPETRSR